MRYKFLLFDADHTLFDFKKSEYLALKDALEHLGCPSSDEHIERYSDINVKYWKMLERGEIDKISLKLARFVEFGREYGFEEKAEALSDRIGIMKDGKLLVVATAQQLMEKTQTNKFENAFISIIKEGKL